MDHELKTASGSTAVSVGNESERGKAPAVTGIHGEPEQTAVCTVNQNVTAVGVDLPQAGQILCVFDILRG